MKKRTPVIMNMSGIYREEKFWKGQETVWVEAEDITGTNCYSKRFCACSSISAK